MLPRVFYHIILQVFKGLTHIRRRRIKGSHQLVRKAHEQLAVLFLLCCKRALIAIPHLNPVSIYRIGVELVVYDVDSCLHGPLCSMDSLERCHLAMKDACFVLLVQLVYYLPPDLKRHPLFFYN